MVKPAESYPRYSNLVSPSIKMGSAFLFPIYPTPKKAETSKTVDAPKVESPSLTR